MKKVIMNSATMLIVGLSLIACGKQVSVKDDWAKYQLNAVKIQQEMQGKQAEIQQKMQQVATDPTQAAGLVAAEDKLINEVKDKMLKLNPETEPVKKVNQKMIEMLDKTSAMMKAVPESMKTKNMAPMQEAQKALLSSATEMQAAEAEVIKAIQ